MATAQNTFITNQEKLLSDIISGILPKTSAFDILVGYFYFSGYHLLVPELHEKHVRILVGLEAESTMNKQIREIELLASQNLSRAQIKENFMKKFVKLFNETDFADSNERLKAFTDFYNKIIDGTLEIRKTEDPCHAKMYLFQYNDTINEGGELPGCIITGSSNFTHAGLQGRVEINARFNDKSSYTDGKYIFEDLWKKSVVIADKDHIEDFTELVIKKTWYDKLYRPYLMYIKVLNEYFSIPSKDNMLTPYDVTDGKYSNLKYQTDAVQMALNAIENHNGVIVADVVGLGKSIIGSTVARNLKLRTIIICPPHLVSQWNAYKDEFGFTATVFSNGKISEALNYYFELRREGEQFLIVIDEAHRYRNEFTEDYANLHNLCSDNKVVLLTATPFNNRPEDIYSMLKLFQIPTKSTLKTVENLGVAFKELISKYKELTDLQREGKINDVEVKEEANRIAKSIRSIISPLVVRRSRVDLINIPEYKEDLNVQGIQLTIPEDPIELTYDLSKLENLYLSTLEKIDRRDSSEEEYFGFKAARYSPVTYVIPDKKEDLAKKLEEKTGININLLIGRQTNIASFMRKLLVSRFESSVAAFKSSLEFMIKSSENVLKWIDKSGKVPVFKKGNLPDVDLFYISTDDGVEEISAMFDRYEERGFFEIEIEYLNGDFVSDVQNDIKVLQAIHQEWFGEDNIIHFDPKLDAFKAIIKYQLQSDSKRKLIVFTEFADTANYIGTELQKEGLPVFKYTSADSSSANKDIIRTNFDAGIKEELQKNDYHVLVATDAISEGYNLHRAGSIYNYDIPYNPTRVIQRIGRINRVNKKMFDKLFIYNYFPSSVGESETRTKEISTLKMAMIHAIMGEDTKALTKDEEIQAFFLDRYKKEFAKSEEASWDSKYRQLLGSLKGTEDYKAALEIPFRGRTAREYDGAQDGVIVFGKKGNDFVFKFCSNTDEVPIMLTAEEAIGIFEAAPDVPAIKLSKQFDEGYQKIKATLFSSQSKARNNPELIKALHKVKLMTELKSLDQDYLVDLRRTLESDSLSGFELRFINKLKQSDYKKLPSQIKHDYLSRLISSENKVTEGEETLILTEELQSR